MAIAIKAEQRAGVTKGDLRQLRMSGQVPGVVYGKKLQSSAAVSVSEKELSSLLRSNPNAVLELTVPESGVHSVMVADVQRDSLSHKLLHVDFHQINMDEEVRASVRIDATGDSTGVREGGILSVILHELEVQCLPGNIPDAIEVDVSELGIGDSILVSDLKLPQGVEAKSDSQLVIVTVLAPQKELSEEEKEAQDVEAQEAESRSDNAVHEEISTST
ncbi:50S ribosomal protein L25/general stress protein Ctc [Paenibacillus pinisoli]|uniref:Large ribosomal subunit protein bL25 n=1 Tax=Paenibacillus pinisoli TaxID=1276110 RepID=A0A3A6P9L1_9BACL|nr:50S ribosomal protein L25/general stress protein Ctc [Paenibacillus pinisoli]RJX36777.1 50S ribosomal protein L25/general stress protein Ctc [Paenibacillus pinisoli]